jgi:glycine/D-amino acid oxidase-like deaminating enzyme
VINVIRQLIRPVGTTDVVVIGAGHAGLAASYFLSKHAIEHVVLERGEVANSLVEAPDAKLAESFAGFRVRGRRP